MVTELAKNHPAWPVASEPQCAPGMAGATEESLPCPGDDRLDLQGMACSVGGEVAATGHGPASSPLRGVFQSTRLTLDLQRRRAAPDLSGSFGRDAYTTPCRSC